MPGEGNAGIRCCIVAIGGLTGVRISRYCLAFRFARPVAVLQQRPLIAPSAPPQAATSFPGVGLLPPIAAFYPIEPVSGRALNESATGN